MRAPLFFVIPFLLGPLCAQVGFDKEEVLRIAADESRGHHGHLSNDREMPARGYDMVYHRLELIVDPAVRAIAGTVTHYFKATDEISSIVLDLSDQLSIDSISYHGEALAGTLADDLLTISFPQSIALGQLDSITISWSGIPPLTGFGSFNQASHSGTPILWTLSEPYGARDWWPCKQDLGDKADSLDMFVTTPAGQRVAGNGLLVSEVDLGSGLKRSHWKHRYPVAHYLIAFAVTNYAAYSDFVSLANSTVEVLNYVYPEDSAAAAQSTPMLIAQMQLYSDLFGEYPFANEKYGHAQFSWGGGMEHQTMSFMGGFSFELMAHELAHQWFGDKVTCGSWEDLWLNEGFATYLMGLCYEHLSPSQWLPFKYSQRDNITSRPDGSVKVSDTTDVSRLFSGRLTYAKGAFLVHMLRWVCGDEAFYAGCRSYLNDPALSYGSATTADLKAHLEASSGKDLTRFFANWYSGQGFPIYKVRWSQGADDLMTIEIDQTTSHPSVDFFEMPVPIRFSNGVQDTTLVLDHRYSGQYFTAQFPFQADSALFDPEVWLLSGQTVITRVPPAAFDSDRLVLYPNPVLDRLTLYVGTSVQGPVTLTISEPSGRIVRSKNEQVRQGYLEMDVFDLASGVYHLSIVGLERSTVVQFVKR